MPELPEVETVMRGLTPVLSGRVISAVETRRKNLRTPFPPDLKERVEGKKVFRLSRRAKYCLIHLEGGDTLVIHLGMSGRMLMVKSDYIPQKHDHFLLTLDNTDRVVLNDPRRFGMVFVMHDHEREQHAAFHHLGPEPLGNEFHGAYLKEKLKGRTAPIKLAIMDQRIVVGVGNIYACEALFRSGINPQALAGSLSATRLEKLVAAIRAVLQDAIEAGGSSLKDYMRINGELGYFQHRFSVYDREGQPCPTCEATIKRIVQGGRSSFSCPRCQKR